MKKIHIIISGEVQGVGFRYWLYQQSNKRNVYGWVRNGTENEVEAILLGHKNDVNNIINLCKKGPATSKVESIKISDYQQEYFRKSFDILYE